MCKNVSWHAARRTIPVLLYCQISHLPILVIFSQCEPGVEGKIKASQIRWGFLHTILAQIESLKVALEEAKDSIIGGVKADLDGRRLGSQSYFDKEEIIKKMGELHGELLRCVEVVGRRSATVLQAGGNYAGHEVTVGGSDSVSSLTVDASVPVTLVP